MLLQPTYTYALAVVLAILEIHIEGPNGWAGALPTWRRKKGSLPIRVLQLFLGGREITGYHCSMFLFVFMSFHLGYAQGLAFSWTTECLILSNFFLFCPVWDFLWFALNPYYGIGKFRRSQIDWHKDRWWPFGIAPVDYFLGLCLATTLAGLGAHLADDPIILITYVMNLLFWAFLTGLFADGLGRAHARWHLRMLEGNAKEPAAPPSEAGTQEK